MIVDNHHWRFKWNIFAKHHFWGTCFRKNELRPGRGPKKRGKYGLMRKLKGNGERKRKWGERENGEMERGGEMEIYSLSMSSLSRNWISICSFSCHFLSLSSLSISLLSLHFLIPSAFSLSLHFLIFSPVCGCLIRCFLVCCVLLADSIYGICRERGANLNISVSRKYSWSKQLPRKPAK